MARKRTTKDFAISMDEFHPRPSTAAAFADRKANDSCLENLTTELKRLDAKIEIVGENKQLLAERRRIEGLLVQTRLDRERTEELIQEAKVK